MFVDDPDDAQAAEQRPAAVAALRGRAFISVTVLLEFEWVLRGFHELPRRDIVRTLRALVGLEHLTIEDRGTVMAALDAFGAGLDFADALHPSRSSRAAVFATFGQRLANRAQSLAFAPTAELVR